MSREPVERGAIPEGGPIELLRHVELQRVTGLLCFAAADGSSEGEIVLVGGEIAVDQPARDDGRDPVDILLELSSGTYELRPQLPPLSVSKGDDYSKHGSLAVHVPVDLMTYCEHAGLTGVLELRHEGRKAEAFYEGGELLAIQLDGSDAADLHEVFGWEQGRFRITLDPAAIARFKEGEDEVPAEAVPAAPAEAAPPPQKKREDTRQFLRVVEMALADVIHESEKARSPTRTSPPLPEPPKARPRPPTLPPPRPRAPREATVRLIYLSGDDAPAGVASASDTRHVHGPVTAELALTEALPERRAVPEPAIELPSTLPEQSEIMAKKRKNRPPAKSATPKEDSAPSAKATPAAEAKPAAKSPAKSEAKPEVSKPDAVSVAKKPEPADTPKPNPAAAAGWALGVVVLGLFILAGLAMLPPVSCPPGREVCSFTSGCVNLALDAQNCGACGNVCASGTCQFGECAE